MKLLRNKTARNVFGAGILQAGNFIVPLVLLPWFARTLGVAGYGQIAYITAVVAYYVLVVDWGFSLSSTRTVAIHRDNRMQRSRIFWETIIARMLLAILGAVALECMCYLLRVTEVSNYRWAYLMVWATAINPAFYYQGIEQVTRMAIIQTGIRLSALPLVMLTVISEQDLPWAIGISSGAFFMAALVNIFSLIKSGEIQWVSPNKTSLAKGFITGWPLFLSTAAISLYTNTNTVILGLVAGNVAVGYFSSAMVFIKAAQGLYQPVSQVFFPKMSYMFANDLDNATLVFMKLMKWQSALTLIGSVLLFILAPWLVKLALGEGFEHTVAVLHWLSPLVLLIGISNVLGIQGMIPLGYNSAFTRIVMCSGLLNVALITPLGSFFGAEGGAMAVLIAEGCVTLFMAIFLFRHEPKLVGRTV